MSSEVRKNLFMQIKSISYKLSSISLKGVNLSSPPEAFENLISYLDSSDSSALQSLHLSWTNLGTKHMATLMQSLLRSLQSKDIYDLNLSYNTVKMTDVQNATEFMENLKLFLS